MIIQAEIIVTPDLPTIKFRNLREQVDLDIELPKILHAQGWGCGTYFHIQFLSHDRTKLLSSANYVVTNEIEELHTNEANPYQPVTKTLISRKASIIGDWQYFYEDLEGEKVKTDGAKIVWNPGKKLHQLKLGDEVIYESADKEEVRKVAEAA